MKKGYSGAGSTSLERMLIDRRMIIGGGFGMLSNEMKRYVVGYIDGHVFYKSDIACAKKSDNRAVITNPNSLDGTRVVWDLNYLTEVITSWLGRVRDILSEGGYILVVYGGLDRTNNYLVDSLLRDTNGVQVINSKWSHGLLSNKDSLKRSADQHYQKDIGHSGAAGVASDKRYQSKIMPLRGYLHSDTPPQMVIFLDPEDSFDAMREVSNHGVRVAAICDVDTRMLSNVDYIIPCSRTNGDRSILTPNGGLGSLATPFVYMMGLLSEVIHQSNETETSNLFIY